MGRRKRDKKVCVFHLSPETHEALLELTKELDLREVEQVFELLISTFRSLLISAIQKNETAIQLSKSAIQFSHFCIAVILNYEEIAQTIGRQRLPQSLKPLGDKALRGVLPILVTRVTNFGNTSTQISTEQINKEKEENIPYGMFSSTGSFAKAQLPVSSETDSLPISGQKEENKEGGASANDSQSQDLEFERFSERMEEHRKRLAFVLQRKRLRWDVERLMAVVKEWERNWGVWREEWDDDLVALLSYLSPQRIAGLVRRFRFSEEREPSFTSISSVVLRQIARAEEEGKEVAETIAGDVKLRRRRKRAGMSEKGVVELWNRMAERERLMKRTELTSSLRVHIRELLELHPEREWWERLFSLVPKAVARTKDPNTPRDLGWLFYQRKGGGRIVDWVLSLGEESESEKKAGGMAVFRQDLLSLCERAGMERRELRDLLKKRGVKVRKEGGSEEILVLSGNEEFLSKFVKALNSKDYDLALSILKEEVKA